MLHEKPVPHGPLADDGDGTDRAWTGEKRRRKYLPPSSSSDAPATDMEGVIQGVQEEELWGPEVDISLDDVANYSKRLAPDIPPLYTRSMMTTEEAEALALRLARYRIAYYKKVAEPQKACELKDPEDYSVAELQDNRYFLHLEEHASFEGCFHPDDTFVAELDDYQRLLVFNGLPHSSDSLYMYWVDYHQYYRTYEVDDAYVKYYGELSSKIKWLKDYLDLDRASEKWIDMGTRAWRQAMKIASDFTNLSANIANMAFHEYISELRDDKALENWFLFYFEVWKLNPLEKGSLTAAVQKAYEMNKSSLGIEGMDAERKARVISMLEHKYTALTFAGGITENMEEGEARDLLRKTVFKKFKGKNMAKYAEKKLEIAAMMKMGPRETPVC